MVRNVKNGRELSKIVKNDQSKYSYTYKSTLKSSRLYFEPFQALLLHTCPTIHSRLKNQLIQLAHILLER